MEGIPIPLDTWLRYVVCIFQGFWIIRPLSPTTILLMQSKIFLSDSTSFEMFKVYGMWCESVSGIWSIRLRRTSARIGWRNAGYTGHLAILEYDSFSGFSHTRTSDGDASGSHCEYLFHATDGIPSFLQGFFCLIFWILEEITTLQMWAFLFSRVQ